MRGVHPHARARFPGPCRAQRGFKTKSFGHDFGTYREVVVQYTGSREALEFALRVERATPENWDEIAHFGLYWQERRAIYANAVREGRLKESEVPSCLQEARPPSLPPASTFSELIQAYRL